MGHVGVICPNTPGHLNPMIALGDALRRRGQRVTSFLLGDPSEPVTSARFEVVPLGGSVFPPNEYRACLERLGALDGRAALKHTITMGAPPPRPSWRSARPLSLESGSRPYWWIRPRCPAVPWLTNLAFPSRPYATPCSCIPIRPSHRTSRRGDLATPRGPDSATGSRGRG